jgi:prevent-host-death family protein
MKSVTSTTLDRKTGTVLSASNDGPVAITTRGRETHVLISIAEYERLTGKPVRPQQSELPST